MRPNLIRCLLTLLSVLYVVPNLTSNTSIKVDAFSPATNARRLGRMSCPRLNYSWRPGTELLRLDPSTLSNNNEGGVDGSDSSSTPQLAKDEDYASAVLKGWGEEVSKRTNSNDDDGGGSIASPLIYKCPSDNSSLYGHIYRPSEPSNDNNASSTENNCLLPGIILFHTGAGPQDIFLRWKADSLINERTTFGENGCVVLIADILGDDTGWAWRDRQRYDTVRQSMLVPDENGNRNKLTGRVQAAIDALASQPGVDPGRIGAMGFCLGGHPILELARMNSNLTCNQVKAMVTFHGVFDGVRKLRAVQSAGEGRGGSQANNANKTNILVCTGEDDPFIASEDLDAAIAVFNTLGYQTNTMTFKDTKHGFTNPAQDYNPSDAFAYSEEANGKAWDAALSLLSTSL